jgi:hypothetical protein
LLVVDKLREEILQAEDTRSDLLKLKLSLVGGIGALGLGFSGSGTFGHAELVLGLIPLVCVYVDLLCRHLSLRIVVIGSFLRSKDQRGASEVDPFQEYEEFVQKQRLVVHAERTGKEKYLSPFDLEDWALEYSTYVLSAGILVFGGLYAFIAAKPGFSALFLLSGLTGVAATWLGRREFNKRFQGLTRLPPTPATVRSQAAGSP